MEAEKEREIELHKKLSKKYHLRDGLEFSRLYNKYWNSEIIDFLPKERKTSVLDVGCGTGILLKDLVQVYDGVTGLDLSPDMIKNIKLPDRSGLKELVCGDAENMDFPPESFDVIVIRGAVHHLPNPSKAFASIYRTLKKDGILVISETCNDSPILRILRKIIYARSDKFEKTHKAFLSQDLRKMLSDAGLKIEGEKRFGYLGFPLCGFPDIIPLLKNVPANTAITRVLIVFDRISSGLPFVKKHGWHIILRARKT